MTKPIIDIRNLHVQYLTPNGPAEAVNDVSFAIQPGEVFGLAGESGCGKSTIAGAILRTLRAPAVITGGEILFEGRDILSMSSDQIEEFRWKHVAMVFQGAMNSLNPVITIGSQITDALHRHTTISKQDAWQRAGDLLETVGIERDRVTAYPHELSGGMRQRAVIAIAIALKPPLLIMDEPTTALDVVVQRDILQQISQLKEVLGLSILFITHDMSLLVEFCDRIGIMYGGQLVEMAPAQMIFKTPIHPYTQGLLSSFAPLKGPKVKLTGIPGSPPSLINAPHTCRFEPRCTVCNKAQCHDKPQMREVLPDHWVATHGGMPLPEGAKV
ncbi:ABC transporter ATP-binding protein [uncultured Cohaesibacter sp.]|uniref:ABC transporter ATP-binding protein n=1 Tax=uncultured Cohaesibacter sp. TaxID=1002546 RepID=UPI00293066AA|nr:ABC transporter ATP-binding protein [uncultured Cohaesibacter sp.]